MKDRNNEIYAQIDRITDHLAAMPKQDRIAWFRRSAYVQPLNFIREIDGTVYAVRAFFSENARENITEKVAAYPLSILSIWLSPFLPFISSRFFFGSSSWSQPGAWFQRWVRK